MVLAVGPYQRNPAKEHVLLKVYNASGTETAILVNKVKFPGSYEVFFDPGSISPGLYICELRSGKSVFKRKMIMLE